MIRQDMDNNKASNTPEVRTPQWNLLDISLVSAAIIVFFIGAALGTQIFFSVDEAAEITILTSVHLALLEAVVLIFSVYFFGLLLPTYPGPLPHRSLHRHLYRLAHRASVEVLYQ